MQALTFPTPDQDVRRPYQPLVDARGHAISGASAGAIDAYEQALATSQSWRSGADTQVAGALQQAPDFVMAHVLQAYLSLCNRDPQRIRSARPIHARAAALPANERERMHLAAIGAALGDDYEHAKSVLGELLCLYPRDALALQVAHMFDYVTGDAVRLRQRVAAVLPAWSPALPGYHAVLAMHAFGLEESGQYELAAESAGAALELNPADARAHHVMAHVFEMSDRPADGARWMDRHARRWGQETIVATHCWWHLGLFELAQGRPDGALAIYDQRIRASRSTAIADLIDASALLWRVQLAGGDIGARWAELADAWAPRIDDGFCSFNDLHAMLAFVGAHDWERARRFERRLVGWQSLATRHGATTRQIGLPACRALIAFGQGNDTLALTLLASLPARAHRFGGSHAQRDVLHLTMQAAIERLRRPRRPAFAPGVTGWRRRHDGGTGAPCAVSRRRSAPAAHAFSLAVARAAGDRGRALRHPD